VASYIASKVNKQFANFLSANQRASALLFLLTNNFTYVKKV
jgi:hypothetical protein